jgi:Ca2+-binding EF-hand superfamily protein
MSWNEKEIAREMRESREREDVQVSLLACFAFFAGFFFSASLTGCRQSTVNNQPAAATKASVVAEKKASEAKATPTAESAKAAETEPPTSKKPAADKSTASEAPASAADNKKTDDKSEESKEQKAEPPKPAESKPIDRERIAILTPGGPMLMDVRLTLDGHAYAEGVQSEVNEVLEAADTNKDGKPTWKELFDNAEYLKKGSPEAPESTSRQKKMWLDEYDLDRDGYIGRDEAAAWAGRAAGRTVRAFAVRSSRAFAPDPRATSRLWALFDADGTGTLSLEEMRKAPTSLLRLDDDDDEMVTPPELMPLEAQLAQANSQRSGTDGNDHYAAIYLEPKTDVARVEYLLNALYSPRQDLSPKAFTAFTRLGDKLDENSDDWIDREELEELFKTDAYVNLSVAFTAAEGSQKPAGKLHLDSHAPEVTVARDEKTDRTVLTAGGTKLVVMASDLSAAARPAAPGMYGGADRNQIRLMVHDQVDALFDALDANADGRLGAREIASCTDRLLAMDADRSGELTVDELPYVMVAAFVRAEAGGEQSFYTPPVKPVAAVSDTAPRWFKHADFNGDGDISRREFLGSVEQFTALDANHDGFIELSEASSAPVR